MENKLEKVIEPNEYWRKQCVTYGVDWHELDWTILQEQEKDYSKQEFKKYVLDEIKKLATIDKMEVLAIDSPSKAELMQLESERTQDEMLQKQKEIDEQYEALLEQIKTTPTPNIDKLTWKIQEWLDLVLSNKTKTHTLFIRGPAGVGKTTIIKRVLRRNFNDEQLKKIINGGHLTPLTYYCNLYDDPDGLMYWNDLSKSFFINNTSLSLLKQSTDTQPERKVDYGSTSPKLGNRIPYCIFRGKQIFDINAIPHNEDFQTIISRSPPIEFNPTNKEMMIMMFEIIKDSFMEIKLKEKINVVDYIKRNVTEATKNFDLRKLGWFMDLYVHCGTINEKFIEMSKALLEVDEGKELVLELSKSKVSVDEQYAEYQNKAEEKCLPKSRATFFNYRKEMGLSKR